MFSWAGPAFEGALQTVREGVLHRLLSAPTEWCMASDDVLALIHDTEQHYAQAQWSQGRALAEQAWPQVSADDSQDEPTRCRVGLLLCQGRYRTGAASQMLDLGLQIAPLVRQHAPSAKLNEFMRMVSLVAADTYHFDVALAFAQEAHQLAQASGDLAQLSLSINSVACFFERSGDPWQAERLLHEALALARQQTAAYPVFVALNNLSGVLIGKHYLLRDALPLDEALLPVRQARPYAEEAVALAPTLNDPFYAVFTEGNLGEVMVHLGQETQASERLQAALVQARHHGFEAQVWRITCSLGELALAQGNTELAWTHLQAVLSAASSAQQPIVQLRAHHALWRTAAQRGQDKAALEHLQWYVQLERARSTRQLRAQSELFVTRMEVEQARQDARRHRQRVHQLEVDVRVDALTGLGNRREFDTTWPTLVQRAEQDQSPLSAAMLDLDHFKLVNDQYGHAVGDQVLSALGRVLRAHTRTADLLVRMGGEEFLLAMPNTDVDHALEVCERLRQQVAEHPWPDIAPGLQVTLSLGLACAPPQPLARLVEVADAALYRAKSSGRNSLVKAD